MKIVCTFLLIFCGLTSVAQVEPLLQRNKKINDITALRATPSLDPIDLRYGLGWAASEQDEYLKNEYFEWASNSFNQPSTISLPPLHISKSTGHNIENTPSNYWFHANAHAYFNALQTPSLPIMAYLHFNPEVRMMDINSQPIRCPSFIIGGGLRYRLQTIVVGSGTKLHYLESTMYHHSNGQDGRPLGADDSRGSNGKPSKVNTFNGNFSTNFNELIYYYLRVKNKRPGRDKMTRITQGLQIHHKIPGSFEPTQQGYFLRWRYKTSITCVISKSTAVRVETGNKKFKLFRNCNDQLKGDSVLVSEQYTHALVQNREKWRWSLDAEYGFDPVYRDPVTQTKRTFTDERRLNISATVYWSVGRFTNNFLFMSLGWTGHDNYNIYYQDNYYFAKAGLAVNPFMAAKSTSLSN